MARLRPPAGERQGRLVARPLYDFSENVSRHYRVTLDKIAEGAK